MHTQLQLQPHSQSIATSTNTSNTINMKIDCKNDKKNRINDDGQHRVQGYECKDINTVICSWR